MKQLKDFIVESSTVDVDNLIDSIEKSGNNKNIKNLTILDAIAELKNGTREDILDFVKKLNKTGIKYEVILSEDLNSTLLDSLLKSLKPTDKLDLSFIDVSHVDDLSNTFNTNSRFVKYVCTVDVSKWDVSKIERFNSTFEGFEGKVIGLEKWNVSKAVSMYCMFKDATKFDADLSKWNVSNVRNMDSMFRNATKFDSDLENWDVSNVGSMCEMLYKTSVKKLPSWYKE